VTPTWGEKDIMYEAINSIAAGRKAERASVDRGLGAERSVYKVSAYVESRTVKSRSGRRTESARASSGNLH
jgi:hypothetical protein